MLVPFKRLSILFVALSLLLPLQLLGDEAPAISAETRARVKAQIDKFVVSPEMKKRATALKHYVDQDTYQQKVKDYEKRIAAIVGIKPKSKGKEDDDEHKTRKTDKFILFISASMPITTLRRYAKDMAKVNGLMVLRGTIGDDHKLGPTLAFMAKVLKKNPDCEGMSCQLIKANVTIDPRLFAINQVKQVPALVLVEDMLFSDYIAKKTGDGLPAKSAAIVYGDASLKGMIKELIILGKQ